MKTWLALLLFFVGLPTTTTAQVFVGLGAGGRVGDDKDGITFHLAVPISIGRFVVAPRGEWFEFQVLDSTVAVPQGANRYYMDTFSNGQSRCRDRTTGQFVDTALCTSGGSDEERFYTEDQVVNGAVELRYVLKRSSPTIDLGYGVIVGSDVTSYLVGSVNLGDVSASHFYINGMTGDHMAGVEAGYAFHIR